MANKRIITIAMIIFITLSSILIVPITFISFGLSTYDILNESKSFKYTPDTPSSIERLNLHVEIGDIEIRYVDPPVDYFVKIDVNIEMVGSGLIGKRYSDYFNIIAGNLTSSPIEFSMEFLSDSNDPIVQSLIENVSITVNLRKGIIFNIYTNTTKGNVDISVPFRVQVGNMDVHVANGNYSLNLMKCIIEGNITGIINNGGVILKSIDAGYTRNSELILTSNEVKIDITQESPLGANVTGIIGTPLDVPTYLIYNDYSSEVGAKFILYDYNYLYWIGKIRDESFNEFEQISGIKTFCSKSNDFPTNNNYIFSFYIEGILDYDLYSG